MDLLDCGHPATKTDSPIAAGIARDEEGNSMCYDCAYEDIMDNVVLTGIEIEGKTEWRLPALYMSSDGATITTWDGQFVGRVTFHGEDHPWARRYKAPMQTRHHIDVKITYGVDVVNAYGIGAPGEYCVLRRRKGDTARKVA
jgi:hypothetical protein